MSLLTDLVSKIVVEAADAVVDHYVDDEQIKSVAHDAMSLGVHAGLDAVAELGGKHD